MKKLMLDVDALVVATFEPVRAADLVSVAAHEAATPLPCSAVDACPSRLCTPRC